jgi:hypothetical protein
MSAFEDFVTLELPRRPFALTDGLPGQFLVRSPNPFAVRELIWTDGPSGEGGSNNEITLEAGEDITISTPLRVSANKFYRASHIDSPIVVGLAKADALTGFPVTAMTAGRVLVTGFTPGAPYFLGDGEVLGTAPSTGFVVRVGRAVTDSIFLINIEMPALLT